MNTLPPAGEAARLRPVPARPAWSENRVGDGLAGKRVTQDFIDIGRLNDRDRVAGTFLVRQKNVPLNKNGKPYIAMVLMNRSGAVDARLWDNVDQFSPKFDAGDFIEVRSVAVEYQNRIQLKVEWLEPVAAESVDPEEFLPATSRDRGEMLGRVRTLLASIHDASLREILVERLDDSTFRRRFTRAPAAKTIHHAYLGGLLEHTLSVMELAQSITELHPWLDRDILIAGAFLHDIGKTRELDQERSFDYTDEGRLIGHIVMGAGMFNEWVRAHGAGLADDRVLKLTHMILSHHGTYEFGSPKRPKFVEALVLNYLDELDSKMQTFKEITDREAGQKWTSYQKLFDRYLYMGTPVGTDDAAGPSQAPETQGLTQRPFSELESTDDKKRADQPELFGQNGSREKEGS